MHYHTSFLIAANDGQKTVVPSIGTAYATICQRDSFLESCEIHFQHYQEDGEPALVLVFSRLEDLLADLYRTGKERFGLRRYSLNLSSDGALSNRNESTSLLSFKDLQEFLIASYASIEMPVHYVMNIGSKSWRYYGQLASHELFEIF